VYSVVKTSQIKPKIAEAPPNINNLVFDGDIQFDLLADVPIRQPMKKRAGRDQEKPRDQVQISP